jgi:dihydroorotate dehydrogenase (fumarate)
MANLETTYLGLKLKNPLVAASSGLTGSLEKIKELYAAGIGAVVLKSIFEEQINNEVGAMLSDGAQNMDYPEAEDYIRNYLRDNSISRQTELVTLTKQMVDVPVIASVNCVAGEEWTSFARDLEEAGADAIELNIFYLPVNRNQTAETVEQLYTSVVRAVKSKIKIPLSVKIGSHFSNIVGMADKLKANGASGIVMFNRFYEPDINLEKLELTSSEVFSSPEELRHGLRWTGLVSSHVPNLDIAASTGIHDGNAAVKQLLAGAQVTQLCSTLYINGASVIPRILEELTAFMKQWNFRKIEDFRGRLSYRNLTDPMMYERSQFMKYYANRK